MNNLWFSVYDEHRKQRRLGSYSGDSNHIKEELDPDTLNPRRRSTHNVR